MQRSRHGRRIKVSADGKGVVSHAGCVLLREVAELTGLTSAVTDALIGTYQSEPIHPPGRVFTDLAVAVADGADAIAGTAVLRDREELFGPLASPATTWRVLDRIRAGQLDGLRQAMATARARAWAAGAAPPADQCLHVDVDATITVAHSEKQNAAKTWKKTFGFHPLLAFLDRPDIAGGEALACLLRPGNAGSNTATDHIELLQLVIAALPSDRRPGPDDDPTGPAGTRLLIRSDSAGASLAFAAACREQRAGFSFGFPVDERIWRIYDVIPEQCWHPALDGDDGIRDGAWVTEATDLVDLTTWPAGTRLILRKERPHPGAQHEYTDLDGMRVTALITDTTHGVITGQVAGLELRHRHHARVEDRIREGKNTGLRNLPCRGYTTNIAWAHAVLAAINLVAWTKLLGFTRHPTLARCEIQTFRYRVLHVAARLTHSARNLHLRIDHSWRWAEPIAQAFTRIRAAFT